MSAASYLPFGPPGSLTFGNGRTLAKTHDQNYWIDAVNGTPAGLSLDFGTDEVGNIVGLTVGAAANNRVYDCDERFNGRFRDECLNEHWVTSLLHARAVIETWRREYNEERPKEALGGLTPAAYAKHLTEIR